MEERKTTVLTIDNMRFLLPPGFRGSLREALLELVKYLEGNRKLVKYPAALQISDTGDRFIQVVKSGGKHIGNYGITELQDNEWKNIGWNNEQSAEIARSTI